MSERDQLIQLIASTIRPPAAATIDQLAALDAGPELASIVAALRALSLGRLDEAAQMASGLLRTAEEFRLVGEAVQALAERKPDRAVERAEELADLRNDREDQ